MVLGKAGRGNENLEQRENYKVMNRKGINNWKYTFYTQTNTQNNKRCNKS